MNKTNKKTARLRRARRTRALIKRLGSFRLCVHKTPQHIYAQIVRTKWFRKLLLVLPV